MGQVCRQRNHHRCLAASVKQTLRLETDRIPSQALDPIDGDGQATSAAELPDVEGPNGSPVSSGDTDDSSSCADMSQEHWGSYSGSETDEDIFFGDTDASNLGESPREARSYVFVQCVSIDNCWHLLPWPQEMPRHPDLRVVAGLSTVAGITMPPHQQDGAESDVAELSLGDLCGSHRAYNVELSWLAFNWRVLSLASAVSHLPHWIRTCFPGTAS